MTRKLLLLAALLLFADLAYAQTQTQATTYCKGGSSTTRTCDFTALPSAGDLIVVHGQRWESTGSVTGCSDNQSNTYAIAAQTTIDTNVLAFICYAMNVGTPSGTFIVTVTSDVAGYWQFKATSWSGMATSNALDVTASAVSGAPGTAPSSGATGTPAQAASLVAASVASASAQASVTVEVLSPTWTEQFEELTTNDCCAGETNTRVISSAAAQTANWTLASSSEWTAVVAVFKAAAAGGGGPPLGSLRMLGVGR